MFSTDSDPLFFSSVLSAPSYQTYGSTWLLCSFGENMPKGKWQIVKETLTVVMVLAFEVSAHLSRSSSPRATEAACCHGNTSTLTFPGLLEVFFLGLERKKYRKGRMQARLFRKPPLHIQMGKAITYLTIFF